jgi:hypothetical protein
MDILEFNTEELCSRKLWQIVNGDDCQDIGESELSAAIAELARRRHYLEELQEMGKLGG